MEYLINRHACHDFGEYREYLPCWDTRAVQLSRGPLNLRFDCFDNGDLILSHLRFDRAASLQSTRDNGYCSIVVHMSPKLWCGMELPGRSLTVAGRQETHVVSHESCDAIAITISREVLATWDAPLAQLADGNPAPKESVFAVDQGAVDRFGTWTDNLFAMPMEIGSDETALWTAALRERLRRHLLDIIGRRETPKPMSSIHRVARYDLALAALRMIQPQGEDRITVRDLARALGVTVRGLEYAFERVLGVSPQQYLLAERLNRARHHLYGEGSRFGAITAVALDQNFGNLSRFSGHYRRLFGESPSQTIRAARIAFHAAEQD